MKLLITVRELIDMGIWEKVCDMKGINPYALSEGLMSEDEEIELSPEETLCLVTYHLDILKGGDIDNAL